MGGPADASSANVRHDVRVRRAVGWYVALLLAVATSLSGCSDASPDSAPTGVDELVIPTPSPDPGDFVTTIDNPWLPLAPGATWSYDPDAADQMRTATVLPGHKRVAGVETTVVETLFIPTRDGQPFGTPARTRDYYAQDRGGNVWWFGREGEWQAGEDGAEAGLAMPAHPRYGDGWRTAYAEGVVDDRASVVTLDQAVTVPAGHFSDMVGIETRSPLAPGVVTRAFYARGTGLVEEVAVEGPASLIELRSGPG
jgi:hypothetical protein